MPVAIRAGKLIDGTGVDPLEDVVVLVERDRFGKVLKGPDANVPPGYDVIDASNQTVLPGLIDCHLHLQGSGEPGERSFGPSGLSQSVGTTTLNSYQNALRDLEAGYTTVRDASSRDFASVAVRDAINQAALPGPRLWVCGQGITSTSGHMDPEKQLAPHVGLPSRNVADGPVEARRAVRINLRYDVDFIKTNVTITEHIRRYGWECAPEMTRDTMKALIEEAHWHGRKVTAHCHGGDGVTWAIEAGIDGLEHGYFISNEQFDKMAERGVYFCPTMSVMARYAELLEQGIKAEDPLLQRFREMAMPASLDAVRRAHQRGVKIIAGSDAAMPYITHGSNAYELEQLVRAGLSPLEAIQASTGTAAEGIGFPDVGTVKPGKFADLIIVEGDPLSDIKLLQNLSNIKIVVKGGRIVVDRCPEEL